MYIKDHSRRQSSKYSIQIWQTHAEPQLSCCTEASTRTMHTLCTLHTHAHTHARTHARMPGRPHTHTLLQSYRQWATRHTHKPSAHDTHSDSCKMWLIPSAIHLQQMNTSQAAILIKIILTTRSRRDWQLSIRELPQRQGKASRVTF